MVDSIKHDNVGAGHPPTAPRCTVRRQFLCGTPVLALRSRGVVAVSHGVCCYLANTFSVAHRGPVVLRAIAAVSLNTPRSTKKRCLYQESRTSLSRFPAP
jgi:hypothetical protein